MISYFCHMLICCFFFFFFQAEDGIRDVAVTGVQTCALRSQGVRRALPGALRQDHGPGERLLLPRGHPVPLGRDTDRRRSEERRVGKECRSRWWPDHEKKKKK